MSGANVVLLVAAGLGAGLTGSVAGLASLISYPALLAVGLSPVSANVTNTVALVWSAAGSIHGSRPELRGQANRLRRLAPAGLLGGAAGAALLLLTPAGAFARAVPWLIALASAALLCSRRPAPSPFAASAPDTVPPDPPSAVDPLDTSGAELGGLPAPPVVKPTSSDATSLPWATFAVAIYGGYFGAAAGVLLLALLLATTGEPLARANAIKNVVLGLANTAAAVGFIAFGPVHWTAVAPLAVGFLIGGRLGPVIVRRVPARLLRWVIGLAGLGLAAHLGFDAYG